MNIPSFIASPGGAALIGLLTTLLGELFGAWLAARRANDPVPAVTVHGRARVRDINVGHRWQTVVHHHHAPRASMNVSSAKDESTDQTLGLIFVMFIVGCMGALAMARFWPVFELIVRIVVALALFTSAALWRRWPPGLAAQVAMRLLIVGIGCALLWAVAVIPTGVAGVPDLAFLHRHTRSMSFSDGAAAVPQLLGFEGLFAYLYRLLALSGLVGILALLCGKAWGVSLMVRDAERGTRSWRSALGAKLTGAIPFGWGRTVGTLLIVALLLALIHPASLEWLLRYPFLELLDWP